MAKVKLSSSSKTDLPGCVQQMEELHATLQGYYNRVIKNNPDYARLMELGAVLIAEGRRR